MQEKINARQALRVFNTIRQFGENRGGEFYLNGLIASTSYDGYTITLRNEYVTLDVFFHNKFSLRFSSRQQKVLFLDKLDATDRAHFD